MSERSVLVTGATGNQGGAVVDALLDRQESFDVYGLTRDADSEASRALEAEGVEMVEGDLGQKDSFREHVAAVDTVYLVTNFWTQGYDAQVQQGKNAAEVAAEEGVDHFVFSGVASHDEDTGIPHFDSAWEIEQHVHDQDLPATIVKPVFFFQNFEAFTEDILEGTLALPLEAGVSLQMVDIADVGEVTAGVIADPETHVGEAYDVPIEEAYDSFGEEFTVMCEWFNEVGYSADIDALEDTFGVEFTDLEEYLRENGWAESEEPAATPGWVKAL